MARIGVGVIGVTPGRSWSAVAHIPALRALPDYEIVALSTTRAETATAAAQALGVRHAFASHEALVSCPEVDLVVVAVKVPHHAELVTAALGADKAIYCEWPLGNGLEEAAALAALARDRAVPAVVGLQARMSPAIAHVRALVRDGYVGEVLSTTLVGSGGIWGPVMSQANAYCANKANGATLLTIPLGHTVDALCWCLGEFASLWATAAVRRDRFTVEETGEVLPMTAEDQVAFTGVLQGGAVAAVHYRGGHARGTNLLWEINGTEGDLQITGANGNAQMMDLQLMGGRGGDQALAPIALPDDAAGSGAVVPAGVAANVWRMYARLVEQWDGPLAGLPDFEDALLRHRMLDAIAASARDGVAGSYAA